MPFVAGAEAEAEGGSRRGLEVGICREVVSLDGTI